MSIFEGISSFFGKTNDDSNREAVEGVSSPLMAQLELDKSDEEILKAIKDLEKSGQLLPEKMKNKQEYNESFWKGKNSEYEMDEYQPRLWEDKLSDNAIFESTETFLAQATKVNPEPTVYTMIDNSAAQTFSKSLKDLLVYSADVTKIKLSIKQGVRYWNVYYLGVFKSYWNVEENCPDVIAIRPQKILLEKNSTIDRGRYTGNMLAEYVERSADDLIEQFPKHSEYIKKQLQGKTATKLTYMEVWTNEYVCWKLGDKILGKMKNPNFNYSSTEKKYNADKEDYEDVDVPELNHFRKPRHPYQFLSIFNLGEQPFDDTSLIEQTIPIQRRIDKVSEQIDTNVERMNGGYVADNSVMDASLAQQAVDAITNNDVVLAPRGSIEKIQGQGLPADVWNERNDARMRLRDVYGVTSLTAAGLRSEDTVRGKILAKGTDGDRIGSGVVEFIEQVIDGIFNHWVQLIYTYMTLDDITEILGEEKALEFEGHKSFMIGKKVLVGMKEGSMIPKDDLTKRNEAIDLWGQQAIDPITFYERLDYPDPKEMAFKTWLYQNNPQQYFAEFGGKFADRIQPAAAPPEQAAPAPTADIAAPPVTQDVLSQVPIT